ncbi:MAG: helix-turn-helix domain-containing protein [Fimbriimonas ginsengisoli]|uniref:Helix-turn-helix domain-containing protein n=1 Tax=Fimbriimonas ginsengisoli TaxID=1005039 RepID=A0A931LUH6_FIMGI|nr:helix-turn-helix domain-containing protein [Fimbriimonas ginsengisoli]
MAVGGVGRRVRKARESLQPVAMRQGDLAQRLKVSQARLSNWERGRHDPPLEFVLEIANLLAVSVDWLMGERVPMRDPTKTVPVYRTGFRFIPVHGAIAAGLPSASEADVDWIEIKDWGGATERWGRVIEGFSMSHERPDPDDLQPGDIAIFEDRRAEFGHVVQAMRNGEDTVKVLRKHGPDAQLWPLNPDYLPIPAQDWTIKGVLVMRIRRREFGIVETVEYPHGMRHRTL